MRSEDHEKRFTDNLYDIGFDVRCQAKEELAPAKDAVQGTGLGTIIVYRLWSFSGAGRTSCDMEVGWSDNSGDFLSA
jgi:hypothetical protein